jgi:transcriptional regulator with XRE-family HTH domain
LKFARLRHEQGLSYNELAARAGVGRSTVVYLESGASNRNPNRAATTGSVETWYRIAKALDVPLSDLLLALDETH